MRAVAVALLVLGVRAAAQTAVFALSGSVALLADLIHNAGDAATAIPLGIAFALRSARAEREAGLAVVLAIFISACVAGYEAVHRLIEPAEVTQLGALAAAGALGFLGNWIAALIRTRAGRRLDSPALIADGAHARADAYVSLAVIASALRPSRAAASARRRRSRRDGSTYRFKSCSVRAVPGGDRGERVLIVAEALTNVVMHADAGHAEVTASVQEGMLHVEVQDDGIGGADPDGHGLAGIGDRVTALGGRLRIESPAGGGTLVAATLPLHSQQRHRYRRRVCALTARRWSVAIREARRGARRQIGAP